MVFISAVHRPSIRGQAHIEGVGLKAGDKLVKIKNTKVEGLSSMPYTK